ncbi:hypothetical protein ASPBRDRAFT_161318 [Aspergillus brasiliensis CBS 101740]|uniref:Uncharacterized protein n=1 Tax=Aspergillus brasiliensis (strain CBS 101740 / IMI 381727 / IBT 21946) TaxID=767769 RepID=A0A1L9U7X0_ASPBC|nr:hypothetical protein ASPBRDRAFT_161318 [Aspergillus brasiliensis CBS 101740]
MLSSLKPTILLALALTAIASPVANPTADEPNTLVARAAIKDVDCDGTKFTTTDIRNAINQAYTGAGNYPKAYMNGEGFFSSTTQLYEYPLVSGTYTGGDPGKYRVIMNEKYNYVGSLYHIRGQSNGFKKCSNVQASPSTTTTTTTTTRDTATATTKASSGKSGHKSGSKSGKKAGTH